MKPATLKNSTRDGRLVVVSRDLTRCSEVGHIARTLQAALDAGDSLIFFPEGTRALTDEMLPFKSGLYHLARANPTLELVPVRMENLSRVMPKGELLPVPLVCILTFGRRARPCFSWSFMAVIRAATRGRCICRCMRKAAAIAHWCSKAWKPPGVIRAALAGPEGGRSSAQAL